MRFGINKVLIVSLVIGLTSFTSSAQKSSQKETLQLTPNECFFLPTRNLRCVPDPAKSDMASAFNKGRFMTHIKGWHTKGDTILWGVKLAEHGLLEIQPVMSVLPEHEGSEIEIHVNGESKSIVLKSTGSLDVFKSQQSVVFKNVPVGTHEVKFTIKHSLSKGDVGYISSCNVSGSATVGAEVWKRRWRPLAVHARWLSSQNPEKVSLAIHENTIITEDIHVYQPITTPFGYAGSTWEPENGTFGGLNFSLWSYGKKQEEPPLTQLSHLIAVGEGLKFGSYGHEGTGVKPRGANPYENHRTNTQVLAIRKEPGIPYDTYYCYYLHPEKQKWMLYGCGRKYNKSKEISYLTTGAFVEEPGPPEKTRNGHVMREVQYKAWLQDEAKTWYPVDVMKHKGNDSKLSYKNWGIKGDKFFMQMGGLRDSVVSGAELKLEVSLEERPFYLSDEMVADLYKLPAEIIPAAPKEVSNNSAVLSFNLLESGTKPIAKVYWGTFDALTFENRWSNSQSLKVKKGSNEIKLSGLPSATKIYYRLCIQNKEGIAWMMDTQWFTTK